MDASFWVERWRVGEIGFHEGQPNSFLARFADQLGANSRVLVPLCGKSEDLAWLAAQGHQVFGVELVEDAVRAFFDEHAITPTVEKHGALTRYTKDNITLLVGDFFAVTRAHVPDVNAFYDRAAMVALPEAMRVHYVAHLRSLLEPQVSGLVVTFDYPQSLFEGPPFAVTEAELRRAYGEAHVELLATEPIDGGRLAALGDQGTQRCYRIR
jgi:thiopurine S-methyltransferase